jgi:sugar/nucleoside kinase (ribokinase family)
MVMESVVIVGSATLDEQVVDGATRMQLGGVVTYAGAALVRGGAQALAVCNLGGPWADAARRAFDGLGIRLRAGPADRMTIFRNEIAADGERHQQLLDVSPPVDAALVRNALAGLASPHLHLGPLHGTDVSTEAVDAVVEAASIVTLDVQGLVRSSTRGPVRVEASPLLAPCLAAARIVKADQTELRVVLESLGRSEEGLLHAFEIDELVVTMGERGGYVRTRAGDTIEYRAAPVARLHDTTGAGDVFFAVYVLERIYRGAGIPEACERAAAVAGEHVAGRLIDAAALSLGRR